MRLTCSKCRRGFQDNDKILATVISTYHQIDKPEMEQFQYAISRPTAATNIQHLACNGDEE